MTLPLAKLFKMKTRYILAVFFFLLSLLFSIAQTARKDSWITDGEVNYISKGDGKIFLTGGFSWFGPAYYSGSLLFSTELVQDESFPKIEEEIFSAISDDAGGWYAGIQDPRTRAGKIIRIRADKTVEELITIPESWIRALARSGNTLYFGGYFQSVNGTTRNSAAALNLTNNTLTSWNPNVDVNGYINVLTVSGSTVYAGGAFSAIGGQARTHIAALDATTGLATSWNVTVAGNSLAEVKTILANAGIIYFGGYFDNVNAAAQTRRNCAAVSETTGALEIFNPRPDGTVNQLVLDAGMLYMAGGFDRVLGVRRFRVARIELATATLTPFELIFFSNTNSNFFGFDQVNAIAINGNKLFIGGTFLSVNDECQPHVAVLDKVTGVLEPSDDKKIFGEISTLLTEGNRLFVGGYIRGNLGTLVRGVAVLDETTGAGIRDFVPELPALSPGDYYSNINFHAQNGRVYYWVNVSDGTTQLGALDGVDGSSIITWSVTVNHHLSAWAFSQSALYLADAGPDVMIINGQTRSRFAAVDLITGALLPFTINFPLALSEYSISSMAVQNDALYTAGKFTFTNNGVERNGFAAWNAASGAILAWSPRIVELDNATKPLIGSVTASHTYLVGNGKVRRVNSTTGVADSWAPAQNGVESIAVHNNSVFLAGDFSPGLVHVDATTALPAAWQPDFDDVENTEGSVDAVAVIDSKLLMGGDFYYEIDGIERSGYAEYLIQTNTNSNSSPTIEAVYQSIAVRGITSFYLPDIVADVDNNVDLSAVQILTPPSSGANAFLEGENLIIDYSSVDFIGEDSVLIEACDVLSACTQQRLYIQVIGDVIIYNALSPNGDEKNEFFRIENIQAFSPDNTVKIYNRWGDEVWTGANYDNQSVVFKGKNANGNELPSGTYFYRLEFNNGLKTKTGYLSIKK